MFYCYTTLENNIIHSRAGVPALHTWIGLFFIPHSAYTYFLHTMKLMSMQDASVKSFTQ